MVQTLFCTDSEINGYIQNSWKALYDLLVDAVEDYALTSTSSTITSPATTFALPADFYKLRGLDDMTNSANPLTVRKFNLGERNDYSSLDVVGSNSVFSDVMYRIEGNNIAIVPPNRAPRPYRVWYIPTASTLISDISTCDVINGFDEWIVLDSAIKCLIKEESDISGLMALRNDVRARIDSMKKNRDQNLPEKVTRVRNNRRGSYSPYSSHLDL